MGEARGLEYEEMEKILVRSVAVMLAAAGALPGHDDLGAELACMAAERPVDIFCRTRKS